MIKMRLASLARAAEIFRRSAQGRRITRRRFSTDVGRESKIVLSRIWAPWRAQYVRDAASSPQAQPGCFLCQGCSGDNDRENLVILREAHTIVVLNRYPYNNGHLLVAPCSHRETLAELSSCDLLEPIETIRKMTVILDRMFRPQGYNIGLNQGKSAGAGLPGHLHWHIVPRWDGDTNFMPILADSKVLIESLYEFYDRITEELRREPE
jgi:ATP adenylyltransferase